MSSPVPIPASTDAIAARVVESAFIITFNPALLKNGLRRIVL